MSVSLTQYNAVYALRDTGGVNNRQRSPFSALISFTETTESRLNRYENFLCFDFLFEIWVDSDAKANDFRRGLNKSSSGKTSWTQKKWTSP
jgi:hypothetical protein